MRGQLQAVTAFALLAGCTGVDLDDSTSAVTNGVTTTEYPSVVALVYRGNTMAFCTGNVIAPRVVITAAHCVQAGTAADITVYFGSDIAQGGMFVDVVHAEVMPGFDRPTLTHDVALLVLATPSPAPAVPIWTQPIDGTWVGREMRLVGFGSIGQDPSMPNTFTEKRTGTATLTEFEDKTFVMNASPSLSCVGDSGGPTFATIDSVDYQVGITRSGDPQCLMFTRDTRVDPFAASFILPFVEQSAEGAAEVSEECYYNANCATGLCITAPDDSRIRYCSHSCLDSAECPLGMNCRDTVCQLPMPTPGAIGSACDVDAQCQDGTCARVSPDEPKLCSVSCIVVDETSSSCPFADDCVATLDDPERTICVPKQPEDGGCCSSSGSGSVFPGLVIVGLLWRRRRRSKR
jgi:MYXO-CTERM domain-containing protein